jgi:hypothetical protein
LVRLEYTRRDRQASLEVDQAGLRQPQVPGRAFEQPHLESPLELRDALAHRLLGDA